MNLFNDKMIYAIAFIVIIISPKESVGTQSHVITTQPVATTRPTSHDDTRPFVTVAVLDFTINGGAPPEMGQQISEILLAVLSGANVFDMVDRTSLQQALQEQELNLTGLVETSQAIDIGKIVGAEILITGKAFALGSNLFITAKLIGTETSRVEGVLVKGEQGVDLAALLMNLTEKVKTKLIQVGPDLVARKEIANDPLPEMKAFLSNVELPNVAVMVREEHKHHARPIPVVDPAVETEIKLLLRQCGVSISDVPQNELAQWIKNEVDTDKVAWPQSLKNAELVICGEAFSEYGTRIGNLVSCVARAEINVINRKTGQLIWADRQTSRSVDLSEEIAGKSALQKAGRMLAIRLLEQLVRQEKEAKH